MIELYYHSHLLMLDVSHVVDRSDLATDILPAAQSSQTTEFTYITFKEKPQVQPDPEEGLFHISALGYFVELLVIDYLFDFHPWSLSY